MRLRNAPLVHVLVQVGYPRLISPANSLEGLRRGLQAEGFPRYSEGKLTRMTIAEGAPPQVMVSPRWDFLNRDATEGVQVTDTWMALRTCRYSTIDLFLNRLVQVLSVAGGLLEIALVERLGIRYVDRVSAHSADDLARFVHAGVLAFPFSSLTRTAVEVGGLATEAVAATSVGTLVVRSRLLPPGQVLPPDLAPSPLREPEASGAQEPGLCLDFDHFATFSAEPFDFRIDGVVEKLRQLHDGVRDAFDAVATPYALEQWGPWEVPT